MLRAALSAFVLALCIAPAAATAAEPGTAAARFGWAGLTFSEDFNAPLSRDKWTLYDGPGHAGNGRRTPEQLSYAGGVMTITGDTEGNTEGVAARHYQRYGRWEVRAKSPPGAASYHPVLLLWRESEETKAEFDFMEIFDPARQKVDSFLHYGPDNRQFHHSVQIDATQWHNYAIEWTPDHVALFVDGREWGRTTDKAVQPPMRMRQTIQLDWFPDDGATTTTQMQIDWARAYDLTNGPPGATPPPAPRPTDRTAPRLSARVASRQRFVRRGVRARLRCDEACAIDARSSARTSAKRSTGARTRIRALAPRRWRTIRIRPSSAAYRRIRSTLKRRRSVTTRVTLRTRDAAGNVRTAHRTVTLVR